MFLFHMTVQQCAADSTKRCTMELHLIFHFHVVATDTLNVLIFFSAAMYFKASETRKNMVALMVV